MASSYPTALDVFVDPAPSTVMTSGVHSGQHAGANDAIAALQMRVGITGSADVTSHEYKIAHPVVPNAPSFARAANQSATMDPLATLVSNNLTNGSVFWSFFTAVASYTTTQVRFVLAGAATLSNSGTSIGLYSVDATDNTTLIASVVSTSLFTGATGVTTASWAVAAALTAGSRYAVGFLNVVNSGTPSLVGTTVPTTVMQNELAVVPRLSAVRSGQSSQASTVVGSLSATGVNFYAVVL